MLQHPTGVTHHVQGHATPGYLLVAPCGGDRVYLVDQAGEAVHTWQVSGGLTF